MRENKRVCLDDLFRTGDWKHVAARGFDIALVPSSSIRYARRNMPEDSGMMKKVLIYGLAVGLELLRLENYDMLYNSLFSS